MNMTVPSAAITPPPAFNGKPASDDDPTAEDKKGAAFADLPSKPAGFFDMCCYPRNYWEDKIAEYTKKLTYAPDDADIMENLGACQARANMPAVAIKTLEKSIKLNNAPVSHYWLADCKMHLGDYDGAEAAFARAVKGEADYATYGLKDEIPDRKYDAAHAEKDKARQFALACTAVLFTTNSRGCQSLYGYDPTLPDNSVQKEQQTLESWWGIHDRESSLKQLRRLISDGHSARWQEIRKNLKEKSQAAGGKNLQGASSSEAEADWASDTEEKKMLVERYGEELGDRGIQAWDWCRFICICRWSARCGYITDQEAWDLMLPMAAIIQSRYSSWQTMTGEYLLGRDFWSHAEFKKKIDRRKDDLTWLRDAADSPFKKVAWNTPLNIKPDVQKLENQIDDMLKK